MLKRHDDAAASLKRTLELASDFVPAKLLQLDVLEETDEKRAALEALSRVYRDRNDWRWWWLKACKTEKAKEWRQAAAAYAELVALRERRNEPYIGFSLDVFMQWGLALLEAREYVDAQFAFARAEVVSPGALEPTLFLAKAFHLAGDGERAQARLEELYARSVPEKRRDIALWVTRLMHSVRDYEHALKWLDQLDQEDVENRLRVFFLYRRGQTGKAIRLGRETLGDSRDPVALYVLASVLYEDLMSRPAGEREQLLPEVIEVLTRASAQKRRFRTPSRFLEVLEAERKNLMDVNRITAFVAASLLGGLAQAQEGFFSGDRKLQDISSHFADYNAVESPNGRELFITTERPGGDASVDIWVARRDATDAPFRPAVPVHELNTDSVEFVGSLSSDGLTIYFDSDRRGVPGDGGDLYMARRAALDQPFARPTMLAGPVNTDETQYEPSVSEDGLEIFFQGTPTANPAPNAPADNFIYVATRDSAEEPFGEPRRLIEIGGVGHDEAPHLSTDGLTLFFRARRPQNRAGDFESWMATRQSRRDGGGDFVPFSNPVNLGLPINNGLGSQGPTVSRDWPASGSTIYFGRWDMNGELDLYQATWHPDCNQNGVDDLDDIAAGAARDENGNGTPDSCERPQLPFRRADPNGDQVTDLADGVFILNHLFLGRGAPGCMKSADANDSGDVDIADGSHIFSYLFLGGPAPPAPFPGCGVDPVPDALSCLFVVECP